MVAVEEFEATEKHRSAQKSPILQVARISRRVTLLLDQDSEMAFSHMAYRGCGNVTRVR